jgi:hypothetical protein
MRGALSDIPSSQPVADELSRVVEFNERVRRLRAIIDSARPHISELVNKVVSTPLDRAISSEVVRAWREQVNSHVARCRLRLPGLCRLKLASVRAFGAELIVKLRGMPAQSPMARGGGDHRRLGGAQGHRLRARRAKRSSSSRRPPHLPPG